jgi:hypothetical protein
MLIGSGSVMGDGSASCLGVSASDDRGRRQKNIH